MAFVDVALLVGTTVGLEGTAAVVGGGALIGAGVGGGYSAITGDGNILNSMLTGAAIGGGGAYGIGSMGAGSAATQAAMAGPFFGAPATAPVAAGVGGGGGGGAGLSATSGAGGSMGANSALQLAPSAVGAPVATGIGGLTASSLPSVAGTLGTTGAGTTAGLSGAKMLGYGLAGTTALQLLGNQKRPSAGGGYKEDEYDKRLKGYKISSDYQPSRASQPSPYYRPTYAAVGGIMNSNVPHSFDDETGSDNVGMAAGGFNMANGGMTSLGGYSDGGRMLKGPGDGMSDSIPGVIGGKQPARLADGEFVVPADVVSHLGNGSTDAGAKRLYSMMDNIRQARTGKKKQAPEINVDKYLPVKKASGGIAGYSGGGDATSDDEEKMRKNIMKNLKHSSTEDLRMAMDSMDDQKFLMKNMPNYAASMSPPLQGMIEGNQYGDRMARSYMEAKRNNALKNGKDFEEESSDYVRVNPRVDNLQNYGGIASIGKQLDPETRLNLMADIQRSPYDRNTLEAIRRIGGGVSRKLDKDSNLSAYYEQDPMGRSKSGGVRYTQNFAMGGGVNGGTVGYADGGNTNEAIINQIYQDQLGRTPDAGGLKFYSDALASGQSVADIQKSINQSLEGQNFDTQYITSLYRQNLQRNPEQEGFQFWLTAAQDAGYTPAQIKEQVVNAAKAKEQVDRGIVGQTFTDAKVNALEADPYGGRYITKSIYDLLPDAVNVSQIGNQKAQFVAPVASQMFVTDYLNNSPAKVGKDVLNTPQVQAAIQVARDNGTLNKTGYDALMADLNAAKTADQIRTALSKPQGQVVMDAIYGQQIGEDVNLAAAQREAAGRQAVLSKQDPGYYQSNPTLSAAYQQAGLTVPMNYGAYNGVDTRNGQANLLTPENLIQKRTDLVNTLNRNNPYRVAYTPTTRGIANMPPSVQDPYSDEGLQFLYKNMMDQYGPPPANFVNPANFVSEPYRYIPPSQNNLTLKAPIPDASKPATEVAPAAPATPAVPYVQGGDRAGGLMSINRKKHKRGK